MSLAPLRPAVLAVALAAALCAAAPARAASACKLLRIADLPVTMIGRQPTVPVTLNGKTLQFLLDTGAEYTMLDDEAVKTLGLTSSSRQDVVSRGVAGQEIAVRSVEVDNVQLGKAAFQHVHFLVLAGGAGSRIDGILGQNVLGLGDIEVDLANGAVRLFKTAGCGPGDDLGYWAPGKAQIANLLHNANMGGVPEVQGHNDTRLNLHARSDGTRKIVAEAGANTLHIAAQLDTGATESVLTLRKAAEAGVTPATPGATAVGPVRGLDNQPINAWTVPFDSFSLGSEEIHGTRLMIGAIKMDNADMLLGADFFLSHRIYIANSQNRLYFTYNGGPVFRLDEPGQGAATPEPAGPVRKPDGPVR